jgi:hypothetical protein
MFSVAGRLLQPRLLSSRMIKQLHPPGLTTAPYELAAEAHAHSASGVALARPKVPTDAYAVRMREKVAPDPM